MFDNVNIDWNLSHDEGSTDFSDDETIIEDRVSITYQQYMNHYINIYIKMYFCYTYFYTYMYMYVYLNIYCYRMDV